MFPGLIPNDVEPSKKGPMGEDMPKDFSFRKIGPLMLQPSALFGGNPATCTACDAAIRQHWKKLTLIRLLFHLVSHSWKKKSMTSKGFLGKVCQKCRNLWVVDFLRENSWKRPELTLRLWIQKCHNNFRQVFNFANLAHGTSGTRDTNMYKNDVQTAKIRECRCPYFWIQRLTLLCHKTAAAIGRHTVHISSSLNLKKLISICIVCIPPVPLVLPLILHCHHVSSCLQLKCSPKANACDWGSMMQSSGLKSSPQTESWNFGDRNQSHFMNSIQFRSTLDIFAAVSASLVLLKLTLIRKHKAVYVWHAFMSS